MLKLLVILSINKYLHNVASRWISSILHLVGFIIRTHYTYLQLQLGFEGLMALQVVTLNIIIYFFLFSILSFIIFITFSPISVLSAFLPFLLHFMSFLPFFLTGQNSRNFALLNREPQTANYSSRMTYLAHTPNRFHQVQFRYTVSHSFHQRAMTLNQPDFFISSDSLLKLNKDRPT